MSKLREVLFRDVSSYPSIPYKVKSHLNPPSQMWVGDKAPLFHQPQLSIRNQCIIFTTWVSEWECYLWSERSNDPTDYSPHPFQERVARDSSRLILRVVVSLTRDAKVPVPSNRHCLYPSNPHVTQPLIYEWHLHARAPSRLHPPFSNKVCTLWYMWLILQFPLFSLFLNWE